MKLSYEQIQDLLRVGNPTDEECRLIRMGWDAALARMRTKSAPDGWGEGVESAARLIDRKAELYLTRAAPQTGEDHDGEDHEKYC